MYPIIIKNKKTLPRYLKKRNVFTLKIVVFNRKYIAIITDPITNPQFLTFIKMTYTGIK